MADAERHDKFIGGFAPHGSGLGELEMMRLGGCAATNEAGLGSNHFEMILVTNAPWLGKGELAFVNGVWAIRRRLGDSFDRIGIHPRRYRGAAGFGLPSG